LEKKYSLRDIGRALSRPVSTISDEISRNSVKGVYDPDKAQHKAYVRRHMASFRGKSIVATKELRKFVERHRLVEELNIKRKIYRMYLKILSIDIYVAPMER